MKKHVIIATGAALLSTSAFATKARMTALGQDSERGSQYIQDGRNKFRNAAHVNNMNNYAVMEWGTAANAEGGFFRSTGSLAYGLYMGSGHRQAAYEEYDGTNWSSSLSPYNPGNELDLFIGGDAGVQWGARLNYMSGEDETAADKRSAFGLGLGMIMGDINAYANIDISDKFEDNTTPAAAVENKGKLGFDLGVAYTMNNMTFHADYASNTTELTTAGTTGVEEAKISSIEVGAAQTHEISSTAMVFFAGQYSNDKVEYTDSTSTPADNAEKTSNALTATIGFEADATSWLTWRGSVAQNIILGSTKTEGSTGFVAAGVNGKKVTNVNSTTVAAGASLTFGKLVVDGSIGTVTAGSLRLDEAFTNVAVSYWF